jgi:hypothetical protein
MRYSKTSHLKTAEFAVPELVVQGHLWKASEVFANLKYAVCSGGYQLVDYAALH